MSATAAKRAAGSWRCRWQQLLGRLCLVADEAGAAQLLAQLASPPQALKAPHGPPPARPRVLAFVNAHAMNLAASQADFARQLAAADVLLRDGAGLALLLRALGRAPGLNLNGTDFIPRLLAACDGQSLAVLGTREPHLSRGAQAIATRFMPRSTLTCMDGFAPPADYLARLRRTRPQVVLLAMGMPRQEQLAHWLRQELDFACLVICGGAIVDFLGGKTARAPAWLRRLGLEWLWRLALEPRRLFVRYVVGNPLFLLRSAWLCCSRSQRTDSAKPVA